MAILASAIWRVRPSGNNLNGGGYDPGIAGAATDYSQQNAAQATGTNATTTGAGSTNFTDATAAAFTSAMIGNCIQIASGTNFQAGVYFVTAFTNANTVVLDRSPTSGGAGSAGVWKLGGGWATIGTNTTSALGFVVPGNTIFILGSGTPNPSSYVYDYTPAFFTPPAGDATAGLITFANDPATPGYKAPPDTTGGMPVIKIANTLVNFQDFIMLSGLYIVSSGAGASGILRGKSTGAGCRAVGCVHDQFSYDTAFMFENGNQICMGCEVFSSVAPGGAGSNPAIQTNGYTAIAIGCNIHDTVGPGINVGGGSDCVMVIDTIIAKCRGDGIKFVGSSPIFATVIKNCTIDGNTGNGITVTSSAGLSEAAILNNIISNHTGGGKSGIAISAGTTAVNDRIKIFIDYNVYYNNTADVTAISLGAHSTSGGSNPYVGQSTENYTLA
jgi:hypothetical protein